MFGSIQIVDSVENAYEGARSRYKQINPQLLSRCFPADLGFHGARAKMRNVQDALHADEPGLQQWHVEFKGPGRSKLNSVARKSNEI